MPRLDLPDGAQICYEILGSEHLTQTEPIVLITGMSSVRGDWDRLSRSLAAARPVLIYDHRGMGDSKLASAEQRITTELLAQDLLALLVHLQWKKIALCGYSMGGVVAQQLLFLPYLPTNSTPLPFQVTHVILAATLCSTLTDPQYGLPIQPTPNRPLSEQEKLDMARTLVELAFDPKWVQENPERVEEMLPHHIRGRPRKVVVKQAGAMKHFDFTGLHAKLPRNIQFLVIHGDLDAIVPPSCGQEILQRIPWAKRLEVGSRPGTVEHIHFGHQWFEYFDVRVWHDVVEKFLGSGLARL